MKKVQLITIILFMMVTTFSFSQDSLKIMPFGMSNSIQKFSINGTETEILNKSIKWINDIYLNPIKVVNGFKVDGTLNSHFTINGLQPSVFYYENYNIKYFVDVKYEIDINVYDSLVIFRFNILEMYSPKCVELNSHAMCEIKFSGMTGFYNKKGEFREKYWNKTNAKNDLEKFVNNLFFSYFKLLKNNAMTSDEALNKLKIEKDKLDLGLITQEEFDKIKEELSKYIK